MDHPQQLSAIFEEDPSTFHPVYFPMVRSPKNRIEIRFLVTDFLLILWMSLYGFYVATDAQPGGYSFSFVAILLASMVIVFCSSIYIISTDIEYEKNILINIYTTSFSLRIFLFLFGCIFVMTENSLDRLLNYEGLLIYGSSSFVYFLLMECERASQRKENLLEVA